MFSNVMYVGESWYYEFEVRPTEPDAAILITSASWELTDGETTTTGDCVIEGACVKALVTPTDAGRYTLTVTVTVTPEVIINKTIIIVRE